MSDIQPAAITRRKFHLQVAAGGLAASAPFLARSQSGKPTIALFATLSGPLGAMVKPSVYAADLAIKRGKSEFGVDAALKLIDDEGNAGRAAPKVIGSIQSDGIKFFTGAVLSPVGLVISAEVHRAGGVYVSSVGADEVTGSACNKSTFRWPVPSYGAVQQVVRPLIAQMPKAKRWYTVTAKYVFGEAMLTASQAIFKEKGVEHVGNSYHGLTDTEFSGLIPNIVAAQPDVLLLLNFGPQTDAMLRQAASFGLKSKMTIVVAWSGGLEQFRGLDSDLLEGVYLGSQYYHESKEESNKKLVAYFKKEANQIPGYSAVNLYSVTELTLRGIKAAGSSEPAAVVKALEGMSYQGATGEETVRAGDHQVLKNYYLLRGKAKAAKSYDDDYADILSFGKSFEDLAAGKCKMA